MDNSHSILGRWNFMCLLGESGGGKGTLVGNMKKTWLPDLQSGSMGDIFRERAKTDDEIKNLIEKGILIDDAVTLQIFEDFATRSTPSLIDGFPRNRSQVLDAVKFFKRQGWRVLVIDLKCDLEVIIERLLSRGRADDKLDIMYKRNLDHRTLHPAVMEEIKNRSDVFDIITLDGNKHPEEVYTDFLLGVLKYVDLLYMYDMKHQNFEFYVDKSETTISKGLNRWLCKMLLTIQEKIDE